MLRIRHILDCLENPLLLYTEPWNFWIWLRLSLRRASQFPSKAVLSEMIFGFQPETKCTQRKCAERYSMLFGEALMRFPAV